VAVVAAANAAQPCPLRLLAPLPAVGGATAAAAGGVARRRTVWLGFGGGAEGRRGGGAEGRRGLVRVGKGAAEMGSGGSRTEEKEGWDDSGRKDLA
jgi:hypothetical protein